MSFEQTFTKFKKYFGRGNFARILKGLPKLSTPVMDLVYPESHRRQYPSALIPLAKIQARTGSVPVVRRGSASYGVAGRSGNIQLLDPQPIALNDFATAAEVNDVLATGLESNVESFVSDKIDGLRIDTRQATEIMCGQTLSGAVAYKLANQDGSLEDYQITYGGSILSLDDVDISAYKIGNIIKVLEEIHKALQKKGYSGKIVFLCGNDIYATILNVVTETNRALGAVFNELGILVGGKYQLIPAGWSYTLPGADDVASQYIDDKFVHAIDLNAPHTLFYAALDDMDANLAPLPFYAKPKHSDDPSGVKIISQSKPLPAPVLNAICKRRLLPAE